MEAVIPPALRVILCRQAEPRNRHSEVTDALALGARAALVAGQPQGYLSGGDDLEVEIRAFEAIPAEAPERLLEGALHTLLIVFADRNLGGQDDYGKWLDSAFQTVKSSEGRHRLLLLTSSADATADLTETAPALLGAQAMTYDKLGETAVRGAHLGIVVLNESRALLAAAAAALGLDCPLSSIFISHGKQDGLPLARAIRDHLVSIPHRGGEADYFYDDRSLLLSEDWREDLEKGVASSLLLIVRTDKYDERPWCRKEVLISERHATPAVVVDARVGLSYGASDLALGDLPTVRVPDGNLIRALHLTLREGLRAAILSRLVAELKSRGAFPADESVRALHRAPTERTMQALADAVPESERGGTFRVFYPDPLLGEGRQEALARMLRSNLPRAWLGTPKSYVAEAAAQAARSAQ